MNTVGAYIKCDICGKHFVCYTGTWKYKRTINKRVKYYCSYSCYKNAEPTSKHGKSV